MSPPAGWVAQLVEQRTENPCVGGSIPPPATIPQYHPIESGSFCMFSVSELRPVLTLSANVFARVICLRTILTVIPTTRRIRACRGPTGE